MSTYVMSFRTAQGLRVQPLLAHSRAQAFELAFALAEQLGGEVRGFCLRRVGAL